MRRFSLLQHQNSNYIALIERPDKLQTVVCGLRGGNDFIHGGTSDDRTYGDAYTMADNSVDGADYLYGREGNDLIWGDAYTIAAFGIGGRRCRSGRRRERLIDWWSAVTSRDDGPNNPVLAMRKEASLSRGTFAPNPTSLKKPEERMAKI